MDFQKWWAQQGHGLWRDDKAITSQVARAAWAAATEAERERCAKLCEDIAADAGLVPNMPPNRLIDAKRWRHARKLLTIDDIEGAQGAFDSFGGLVSEHECLRADAAIDAAMKGANA